MPIPDLPLFRHRDTVVTPADQNQFVTQFENTMDTMSNDVIPALNLAITDINAKTITTTTARDEAEDARDIAVAAKDEALTAVATLQEGAIDDTTIAPNKAFSNSHIQANYYDKTEVYNKTEVDTAIAESTLDINSLTNKPIPSVTDNLAIQETGGLLKKLSFANLMSWVKSFSFGWGQTWQDESSNRNGGVIYTNNTDKPITISVVTLASSDYVIEAFVDSKQIVNIRSAFTSGVNTGSAMFIVPVGATYSVNFPGTGKKSKWYELK